MHNLRMRIKVLWSNRRFRRLSVIVGITWLIIFVGWYIDYTSAMVAARRELRIAEAKWKAHPIAHYRMVTNGGCDVEVRDEQVVKSYNNGPCNLTVSSKFAQINSSLTIHWLNGDGCDLMVVYPTFNDTWGYPEKVVLRQEWASPLNLGIADYVSSHPLFSTFECWFDGYGGSDYVLQSLTPLP